MHEACRFLTALFLSGIFGQATSAQRPCESLAGLAVSSTKITLAQSVPQGAFTPPPSPAPPMGPPTSYKGVPEFCRVVAELTPTADSVIKIEVWMPTAGWNGNTEARATEVSQERSTTRDWELRLSAVMPRPALTRATRGRQSTLLGPWGIRRKWSTSDTVPSTR